MQVHYARSDPGQEWRVETEQICGDSPNGPTHHIHHRQAERLPRFGSHPDPRLERRGHPSSQQWCLSESFRLFVCTKSKVVGVASSGLLVQGGGWVLVLGRL